MTTHRQTWLFSSTSTYHSTDFLTARGVAHLVVHGTSGSTSHETIPPVPLETSGGVLSTVDCSTASRTLGTHIHRENVLIVNVNVHEIKCLTIVKIENESVPIQLAQCWFPGLAIFNAKVI